MATFNPTKKIMKPSITLLFPLLLTPLLCAEEPSAALQSDSTPRTREIEQKVLLNQYQSAVKSISLPVPTANGERAEPSVDLIGKRLAWVMLVQNQIEPGNPALSGARQNLETEAGTIHDLARKMMASPDAGGRRPDVALRLAVIAIEIGGGNKTLKPGMLDTKARALFLLGKRGEAIAEQEQAIAAATVAEEKAGFEATLAVYKSEFPEGASSANGLANPADGVAYLMGKLKTIVIPMIAFEDTSVEEAVEYLRLRTKELDTAEPDPSRKGVNFVIRLPAASSAPVSGKVSGEGGPTTAAGPGSLRIRSLRLKNVPVSAALKYICDATGLRYKVDDFAVTLLSPNESEELFTRTFKVPPSFGSSLVSIQELLKLCGVNFGEGASANRSASGELRVVNTPTELDKIEQLIPQSRLEEPAKQQDGNPEEAAATSGVAYLAEKLNTIFFPIIDFEDTSIEEAVDYLTLRATELDTAELDPSRKGVNFVIRLPAAVATPASGQVPGEAFPSTAAGSGSPRIESLRLRNVPLAVALRYICEASRLRYKVDEYAVTLVPQDAPEGLFTRTFRVSSDFGSPLVPIQVLLKSSGIHFAEGSSAILNASGVMIVTNTATELDKIEQLILGGGSKALEKRHEGNLETTAATAGVASLSEKLRSIIIPTLQFEDTTLEEAVDYLRVRTKELDMAEPDPSRKGVNFVMRRSAAKPAPTSDEVSQNANTQPAVPRIKELRLRNVPVDVALKYICEATRFRYRVDDFAVTLVSMDATEDLFSRTFHVPPDFSSKLDPGAASGAVTAHRPMMELLKSAGIHFAEGTSVTHTPSGTLMVTNTPTELDKIEQLIAAVAVNVERTSKEAPQPVPAPPAPRVR